MTTLVDAIIFSIHPNQPCFIPTEKVAVTFKLPPTILAQVAWLLKEAERGMLQE
jgi:hypothetical protein